MSNPPNLSEARLALHFGGRDLVIATRHGKEAILGPLFEEALGVRVRIPAGFDSDVFGTFTGEIARPGGPLETARAKCLAAMDELGCDLGIASEGSFGPHPRLPFVASDTELLLLVDRRLGLEVSAWAISSQTNFKVQTVSRWTELADLALEIGFPEHALILRDAAHLPHAWVKGIQDWAQLEDAFRRLAHSGNRVHVETDMRACFNPMRQAVIRQAGEQLVAKLHVVCPGCGIPGFDVVRREIGLPCSACGLPTHATLGLHYRCACCQFQLELKHPDGITRADPGMCDHCNP